MAIAKLADAGPEALRLFDEGHYDAAMAEVRRCRETTNTLMAMRRSTP